MLRGEDFYEYMSGSITVSERQAGLSESTRVLNKDITVV